MTAPPFSADSDAADVPNVVSISKAPRTIPVWCDGRVASYALVDHDAHASAAAHRWELVSGYAYATIDGQRQSLHRFVLGLRRHDGVEAHHRNAQRLDCRRANLEALVPSEHALAHGMLPALPVREWTTVHPAAKRGLGGWLDDYRRDSGRLKAEPMTQPWQTGKRRTRELPKTLTQEEVEALMRMPNLRCPTGLRDRCILMVMHRCGLRVSEACGVHLRDVKWKEGQIHVRPEVAKGGREAVVYMDTQTQGMLERWVGPRRRHAAGRPWLFTTLRGTQLSRTDVYAMVRRRARKAGIEKNVSPHMLRHTYATELLREGFNLREVQHLLRHGDIRTTVLYTHLFDADLADKISAR